MISKRHFEGNWLTHTRVASSRYQDPGLSALLVALLVMIFLAEPLAFEGFVVPVVVTGIVVASLVFVLVLGSHHNGALILVVVSGGIRLLTAAVDVLWGASVNEGAEAISAMLGLVGVAWVVSRIVFGPGRITTHRVRGVIVLYLLTAIFFAYLYRLIAKVIPGAFSGLAFRTGEHGALSPFLYFSLTLLTTVGLGDIAPVDAFVRNLTMFEALLGQLFPATILARILTLYADERRRVEQTPDPPLRD
jgi:hypothetical protein